MIDKVQTVHSLLEVWCSVLAYKTDKPESGTTLAEGKIIQRWAIVWLWLSMLSYLVRFFFDLRILIIWWILVSDIQCSLFTNVHRVVTVVDCLIFSIKYYQNVVVLVICSISDIFQHMNSRFVPRFHPIGLG